MLLFIAFCALLVSALLFVLWKGGAAERIVACAFLTAFLVSMLVEPWTSARFDSTMVPTLLIDASLLVVLGLVALRAERRWPLFATVLQVLIVMAHVVTAIDPALFGMTYMLMINVWPFLQIAILVGGTIAFRRAMTKGHAIRSWST